MKTAYGLDLAGYSTGKSSLAKATFDEATGLSVVVYRTHPFAKKLEGWETIGPLAEQERRLLRTLRPLYIDVPIDLRALSESAGVRFVWQLTKRPVDFVYNALPPLADRLGSPVARLKYLLAGDDSALGDGLFETYPAASLIPMLGSKPSYKGKTAERKDGQWVGDGGLADILRILQVQADERTVLNDDHFDAAVCALTGVLADEYLLRGTELDQEIRRRLEVIVGTNSPLPLLPASPTGYVLIRQPLPAVPLRLHLEERFAPESEGGR